MDISALQPKVNAAELPLEQLSANPNISQKDKVAQACRQFEAVLLRQILGEARKTLVSTDPDDNSSVKGIYDDMINNQLADSISRSGELGLAKSLQSELTRQVLPHGGAQSKTIGDTTPLKAAND